MAEKFVPPFESVSSFGFEERNLGCPGNFAGMSRTPGGVQKVCAKKVHAHFSFPTRISKAPDTFKFLRHAMRAILFARPNCSTRLCEGIPFETGGNPQARGQNFNRANVYENEMVQTYRDLNCSGASPIEPLKK